MEIRQERARRSTSEAVTGTLDESRARCKTLAGFIREAWHLVVPEQPYLHNWHIDLLCAHLEAVTRGEILARGLDNRLLINIPPGTAKTLIMMVFWPAWEWSQGSSALQYICSTFREANCVRDTIRFRKIVESGWFQERWPLEINRSSDYYVENEAGGWRRALPFSSLMGGRADRVLIDDPHSIDMAESDANRERAIINFRERAVLSLNDPARSFIGIIMQRLHQRDLSGVVLELELPYLHIMLPMRFDPARRCETPFGADPRTTDGELLFKARFPLEVVARDEAVMGSHAVAGQFDQRPTPRGGLLFKRHHFRIVPAVPAGCRWVAGWDLAASLAKSSAYTCRVLLGYQPRDRAYYIRHVARDRVTNPEAMIVSTAALDTQMVGRHEISIPQDPGAAGKVQARSLVGALAGYTVVSSPESGDKYSRAQPISAQAEAGNFNLVEGPWNGPFLDEIEMFPVGAFKDQVDSLSRSFGHMTTRTGLGMAFGIVASRPRGALGDHPGE